MKPTDCQRKPASIHALLSKLRSMTPSEQARLLREIARTRGRMSFRSQTVSNTGQAYETKKVSFEGGAMEEVVPEVDSNGSMMRESGYDAALDAGRKIANSVMAAHREQSERQRLEREVIEAAKEWPANYEREELLTDKLALALFDASQALIELNLISNR